VGAFYIACNGLVTTVNFSFERPQLKILSREMQSHAFNP
jgi:hypothetical protein